MATTNVDYTGYIVIIILFMVPSLLTIFGILYHLNIKGSDYPNYLSIWRCFAYIADLFTDILVIIFLYQSESQLFLFALGFVSLAYVLSNFACFYHIYKWKKNNIPYVHRYSHLIIILSILSMCIYYILDVRIHMFI